MKRVLLLIAVGVCLPFAVRAQTIETCAQHQFGGVTDIGVVLPLGATYLGSTFWGRLENDIWHNCPLSGMCTEMGSKIATDKHFQRRDTADDRVLLTLHVGSVDNVIPWIRYCASYTPAAASQSVIPAGLSKAPEAKAGQADLSSAKEDKAFLERIKKAAAKPSK